MIRIFAAKRLEGIADMVEAAHMDTMNTVYRVLQIVGFETVAFLRSLTSTMRPPIRPGGGWRPAHPGGWADVTGNLANAYAFAVLQESRNVAVLELSNHMEYAAMLEKIAAFFVLRGVGDRGGPVEQALVKIFARVAPDVRVVYE